MNTKTVNVEIGRYSVEFTEEKLRGLCQISDYARLNDMERYLSRLMDVLVRADESDAINEDICPWLAMLVDMKDHYRKIESLGITKAGEEVDNGSE